MIDISHLEFKELAELRQRIDERMNAMREECVPELRSRFADEAAALGLSLDDVFGVKRKKRGRSPTEPEAATEA